MRLEVASEESIWVCVHTEHSAGSTSFCDRTPQTLQLLHTQSPLPLGAVSYCENCG